MDHRVEPGDDVLGTVAARLTLPDGQIAIACPAPFEKIFSVFFSGKSPLHPRRPGPHKGAFRDRHERRAGMRWTRAALLTRALICGRRSRVVLTPRRWRQVGERDFTRGDGDKKARSPGRARNKPLKPSRAGMPGDPGATVVTNACVLLPYTRGCGCNGHPAFPAPPWGSAHALFVGRIVHAQLGRNAPREGVPAVIARESGRSSIPRCQVIKPRSCGVLDTPLSRTYDGFM